LIQSVEVSLNKKKKDLDYIMKFTLPNEVSSRMKRIVTRYVLWLIYTMN